MNTELSKLIESGATIITPTKRLSRHIHHQYSKKKIDEGNKTWETPNCLTWIAWCERIYRDLSQRINDNFILLGNIQKHWLWRNIIDSSKYKDQILLTSTTTEIAINAYQLCKEWCIPIFPEKTWLTEDALAFKNWVNTYEKEIKSKRLIDHTSLPDYIISHIKKIENMPKKIIFYDFDQLTTQQHNLKQAFIECNVDVEILDVKNRNQLAQVSICNDRESEIRATACWARKKLESDINATIGIVDLGLKKSREEFEYEFASVFIPDKWLDNDEQLHKPYSISLGKSLSSYPLIDTAMDLLALSEKKISLDILSSILRSPFIAGADEELSARSRFARDLESKRPLSFRVIFKLVKIKRRENIECKKFFELLKSFKILYLKHKKRQTLYEWSKDFSEWLNHFGWPGEHGLSSDEYQVLSAWQAALGQLSSLDTVMSPVDSKTALFELNKLLNKTNFQPETAETPIQIIGMSGAAGMQFDYLWVMGLDDNTWPPPPKINPFIPIKLQRDFSMSCASASLQLHLAKHITDKLVMSAKKIIFSYTEQQDGVICRPSRIIETDKLKVCSKSKDYADYKNILYQSSTTETFLDVNGPEISQNLVLNGGYSLFEEQKTCPFKAFAIERLLDRRSSDRLKNDIGLDAIERGNLLHFVMYYLWKNIKSSENLNNYSSPELERIIHSAVLDAIKQHNKSSLVEITGHLADLEQYRLIHLLSQWLEIEKDRGSFEVISLEESETVQFQNIKLKITPDRVDKLPDGRCVLIDYKTGYITVSSLKLAEPGGLQLALYAALNKNKIAAVVFASLNLSKLGFFGLGVEDTGIAFGKNHIVSWQDQLNAWEKIFFELANDFRKGKATLNPSTKACKYCNLQSLCRVHDRIEYSEPFHGGWYQV